MAFVEPPPPPQHPHLNKNNNISYLNLFGEQNKCNEFIIYLFKKKSYLNLFG